MVDRRRIRDLVVASALATIAAIAPHATTAESAPVTLSWHVADAARATATGETIAATLEPEGRAPLQLELEPAPSVSPSLRVALGRRNGPDVEYPFDASKLVVFRGRVDGHPGSSVRLALHPRGAAGFVELAPGGPRWRVDPAADETAVAVGQLPMFAADAAAPAGRPPDVPECATPPGGLASETGDASLAPAGPPDLRRIELAVDTDHEFFLLFDDADAAALYVAQLYAEVSAIFERDIATRVELVFLRLWDQPDDLFNDVDPSPLGDLRDHWNTEMTGVARDVVQLISGRRDYPFGGQAYLSAVCGSNGYSVVGYASGAFPDPSRPSPYNYDIAVTAHELGHNAGTGHTHDGANLIDECDDPATTPQRGTIMSYCGQTWSGGNANRDLWFHTTIRENMRGHVYTRSCVDFDCNANGVDDAADIAAGTSDDVDGNGVPDECEDCNGNGTLDGADVAGGGSLDRDGNGVPDECDPDCDGDGVPDAREIADGTSADLHGNGIPDECEADCDGDGTPDYDEIQAAMPLDVDRDRGLDACADCDGDGATDLAELAGAHAAWVGSGLPDEPLRRFTPRAGVLAASTPSPGLATAAAQDVLVTPDGRVLVSTGPASRVLAFDVATGAPLGELVSSGPDFAAGMAWRDDGTLIVASRDRGEVLKFDGADGTSLGKLVPAGPDGPTQPFALTVGPDGLLYVADDANEIRRYDATSGAFVDLFVPATDNGGLDRPRGMTFNRDGNLLVSSYGTDRVLEYEGGTGVPMGPWSNVGTPTRLTQVSPWGIRVGPNGNVFVARTGESYGSAARVPSAAEHAHEDAHAKHEEHGDDDHDGDEHTIVLHLTNAQIYEFDAATGDFVRAYVGGNDHGLLFPTGFDFAPGETIDCNANGLQDSCDLTAGTSVDLDGDTRPDECQADCDGDGIEDRLQLVPFGAARDCDFDGVPDSCQLASGAARDCDLSGVPDACEVEDRLETGAGWTVGAPGDDATDGIWTLVDPNGTAAQPEDDHTRAGRLCFVTGQGAVGGALGAADVDGGRTTLVSPPLDLADEPEAVVSYWRWFSNSTGSNPGEDVLLVELSNDGGQGWVEVETVGPSGPGTGGVWARHRFRVADLLPPTADVRLRFVASDLGGGSIVEAAIDDLDVERACPCLDAVEPPEVGGLAVDLGSTLEWDDAGAGRRYDVIGGSIGALAADGGIVSGACLADDVGSTSWSDPRPEPAPGTGEWYLVRAQDDCASGGWGAPPGAPPREPGAACP